MALWLIAYEWWVWGGCLQRQWDSHSSNMLKIFLTSSGRLSTCPSGPVIPCSRIRRCSYIHNHTHKHANTQTNHVQIWDVESCAGAHMSHMTSLGCKKARLAVTSMNIHPHLLAIKSVLNISSWLWRNWCVTAFERCFFFLKQRQDVSFCARCADDKQCLDALWAWGIMSVSISILQRASSRKSHL